jgi:lipopolysaccharide export system protein LptC
MTAFQDSYSRLVAWLKFVLPLLALGLLSTLFLLARPMDPERAIPYSEVDVDELAREQQVAAPTYSGMTSGGAAISLVAESIRPAGAGTETLDARTVSGSIEFSDGWTADVAAPAAEIDISNDRALLRDGVIIETSNGYRMETLKRSRQLSTGPTSSPTARCTRSGRPALSTQVP